jgi:hypothetical protein
MRSGWSRLPSAETERTAVYLNALQASTKGREAIALKQTLSVLLTLASLLEGRRWCRKSAPFTLESCPMIDRYTKTPAGL